MEEEILDLLSGPILENKGRVRYIEKSTIFLIYSSPPAGVWQFSPWKISEISTILNAQKLHFPSCHGG